MHASRHTRPSFFSLLPSPPFFQLELSGPARRRSLLQPRAQVAYGGSFTWKKATRRGCLPHYLYRSYYPPTNPNRLSTHPQVPHSTPRSRPRWAWETRLVRGCRRRLGSYELSGGRRLGATGASSMTSRLHRQGASRRCRRGGYWEVGCRHRVGVIENPGRGGSCWLWAN